MHDNRSISGSVNHTIDESSLFRRQTDVSQSYNPPSQSEAQSSHDSATSTPVRCVSPLENHGSWMWANDNADESLQLRQAEERRLFYHKIEPKMSKQPLTEQEGERIRWELERDQRAFAHERSQANSAAAQAHASSLYANDGAAPYSATGHKTETESRPGSVRSGFSQSSVGSRRQSGADSTFSADGHPPSTAASSVNGSRPASPFERSRVPFSFEPSKERPKHEKYRGPVTRKPVATLAATPREATELNHAPEPIGCITGIEKKTGLLGLLRRPPKLRDLVKRGKKPKAGLGLDQGYRARAKPQRKPFFSGYKAPF